MSSLKNIIMDVDVEPLESLTSRRSREAAQPQGEPSQIPLASQSPKVDVSEPSPSDIRRRRSHRVSKSSSQSLPSRPSLARRRSSGTAESMEPYGNQSGTSQPSSSMGIPRQSSRGSHPPEPLIRYTPVTGRVSRAKKGQPVHVCDQCDPPRIFTRAEHLRRHQLGHQKPTYQCTFEDCEKAFHRPDLLARHLNRHETQGEKAFKAGDHLRSRSSSMSSASQTPPFKKESLSLQTTLAPQISPIGSATPRTSGSNDGSRTAVYISNFDFPHQANPQPGSSGQFGRGGARTPGVVPSQPVSEAWTTGSTFATSVQDHVHSNASFLSTAPYHPVHSQDAADQLFQGHKASHGLPLLTIPEQCPSNLSFTNSPRYSSESTWSTPSSDNHHIFGTFKDRDRSSSVTTVPEWSQHNWGDSPRFSNATVPTARLHTVPENYESPPYMDPHFSPPAYRHGGGADLTGGYNMALVGTPTPVTSQVRPHTQSFPASTPRVPKCDFPVFRPQYIVVNPTHINPPPVAIGASTGDASMEDCVALYMTIMEPLYAIIHPLTHKLYQNDLVKYAMAALGSQFLDCPEHRKIGNPFHHYCIKMIVAPHLEADLSSMQAIFLTEVFARFRSPKLDVTPSPAFRKLCKELVDSSDGDRSSIYARLNPAEINDAVRFDQQSSRPETSRDVLIENMWRQWINWEARQRLRVVCVAFDTHQAIYYEQERCQPTATTENTFFAVPCLESLWSATTSQEWFALIHSSDCVAVPFRHPEALAYETLGQLPLPTRYLALTSLLAALPVWDRRRVPNPDPNAQIFIDQIHNLFDNFMPAYAHLALYHTPLRQLLALTGESWVLGKKITSHADFEAMKPVIRSWTVSQFGELATWYACNFLHDCFSEDYGVTRPFHISDYWSIYTCTLIVWAFGQRHSTVLPSSGNSVASASRRTSSLTFRGSEDAAEVLKLALFWIDTVISRGPKQLGSLPILTDAAVVVEAARIKLAPNKFSQPPALLLDACNVLDKLREQGARLF